MKYILKPIIFITYILTLPWMLFLLGIGCLLTIRRARKYHEKPYLYSHEKRYKWVHKQIKKYMWIMRIKVDGSHISYLPKSPSLIICNHKSNIDPLALFQLLYAHKNSAYPDFQWVYIAKIELAKRKMLAITMSLVDVLYLDRDNIRQQLKVYETMVEKVRTERKSIVIFPEGHRFFEDKFGEFKGGSLQIAYKCMIPISPIVVYGSSGLADSNKTNRNKKRDVHFDVLPAMKPHDFVSMNSQYLADEIIKPKMQNIYDNIKKNDLANKKLVNED